MTVPIIPSGYAHVRLTVTDIGRRLTLDEARSSPRKADP